jgi:signal transduction histidine kinase
VDLTVQGQPRALPRGLALSVFRIVQESLTNVRKHAPGSRCQVTITHAPGSLAVEVLDDGAGTMDPTSPGFGIIGMRERARLYDGTLDAGPRSSAGGWAVRARFPLENEAVGS